MKRNVWTRNVWTHVLQHSKKGYGLGTALAFMMLHSNFFSYNRWVSKEIDKQAPGFCSEFVERMNRKNWGKKEGNDSRVRDSLRKIWARFDLGNSLEWWFREGAPEGILGRPKNSMSVLIGKTKIKRCRALKRKETFTMQFCL